MSEEKKFWQRERPMTAILAAAVAASVVSLRLFSSEQKVWFVNALDVPVTLEVDGVPFVLARSSRVDRSLSQGGHWIRAKAAGGEVLEEGPINLPGRVDAVVYNVLGAAPLYKVNVVYSTRPSYQPSSGETPVFLGGERLFIEDDVDFLFTEPPARISMKSNQGDVYQKRVDQVPGGWSLTANYLDGTKERGKLLDLLLGLVRVQPEDRASLQFASSVLEQTRGPRAVTGMLEELSRSHPASWDIQIAYQYRLRIEDRLDEGRARYRKQAEAEPGSALAAALMVRIEPREAARAAYESLLARHPDDLHLLLEAARFAYLTGDLATSVELFAKAAGKGPEYDRFLDEHVRSLVALKRTPEAVSLAAAAASRAEKNDRWPALGYARVASLPDAGPLPRPVRHFVQQIISQVGSERSGYEPWLISLLGDPVSKEMIEKAKDDPMRAAAKIHIAAMRDPAEAWKLCEGAQAGVLRLVHPPLLTLLSLEFRRAGDAELGEALLEIGWEVGVPAAALDDYVRSGKEHPELWRLDAESRAALDFVRARTLESQGQQAEALYEAALGRDLLRGPVYRAIEGWPRLGAPKKAAGKGKGT